MQKCDKVLAYQLNSLLKLKPLERGNAAAWWPRMACSGLCRYTLEMRRFHGSCFWCRIRRFFYGKMDLKKYSYNSVIGIVIPKNNRTEVLFVGDRPEYIILIDCSRRFAKFKDIPLNKMLKFAEWLGNRNRFSRTCWIIRKHILTLCEGLAN